MTPKNIPEEIIQRHEEEMWKKKMKKLHPSFHFANIISLLMCPKMYVR